MEVRYNLMSFGILPSTLPFDDEGVMDWSIHRESLAKRKQLEAERKEAFPPKRIPGRFDVRTSIYIYSLSLFLSMFHLMSVSIMFLCISGIHRFCLGEDVPIKNFLGICDWPI